jgi:hypothetical protein
MRILLLFSAALLTACASSGNSELGGNERTVHLADGTGGFLRLRGSDGARIVNLTYPMDKVWRALPTVFDSLGIPLTDLNPATHILGNSGMKVHKTLGKVSLSKYLECGSTQGYPSAETYDIQISVRTQVEDAGNGATSIGTLVEAAGRPMAFAGEYVRCTTKGELESRIAESVKALLKP